MEGANARAGVDAIAAEFSRLVKLKDYAGIVNMYAPGAKVYMEEKEEVISGRQDIMMLFVGIFEGFGVTDYVIDEVEFHGGEENAVQTGNLSCKTKDGVVVYAGKYITMFKKIGNKWFVTHDFSNSDKHDIRGELRSRYAKWNQMFLAGDYDALVNEMYTDNAKALLPGCPMVTGKASMVKLFKEYPHAEIIRTDQVQGDIEQISADVVVDCGGTFTVRDRTGVPAEKGQYMVVWKRVNGKLLIDSDIMRPLTN